jgi:hypothetical protein
MGAKQTNSKLPLEAHEIIANSISHCNNMNTKTKIDKDKNSIPASLFFANALDFINAQRAAQGVLPLTFNNELNKLAVSQAKQNLAIFTGNKCQHLHTKQIAENELLYASTLWRIGDVFSFADIMSQILYCVEAWYENSEQTNKLNSTAYSTAGFGLSQASCNGMEWFLLIVKLGL